MATLLYWKVDWSFLAQKQFTATIWVTSKVAMDGCFEDLVCGLFNLSQTKLLCSFCLPGFCIRILYFNGTSKCVCVSIVIQQNGSLTVCLGFPVRWQLILIARFSIISNLTFFIYDDLAIVPRFLFSMSSKIRW
jgi:hypothetical protein